MIYAFCVYYMRFHARKKIKLLEDKGHFQEGEVNLKLTSIVSEDSYMICHMG